MLAVDIFGRLEVAYELFISSVAPRAPILPAGIQKGRPLVEGVLSEFARGCLTLEASPNFDLLQA